MSNNPNDPVRLSDVERAQLVEKKAACPFIGSALASGLLPVRNGFDNPLASVEDVRRLGNTGGGNLGEVLVLFADGNHAFMRGASGILDEHAPEGLFSLEFPGSQGSHPGHSGILEGDPKVLGSGRLSEADFARLTGRARDGLIRRSDVGRFIAENLRKDRRSKVLGASTVLLLAEDFGGVVKSGLGVVTSAVASFFGRLFGRGKGSGTNQRDLQEKFTKLTGEDNLVGSAGEFGLLFAFLANSPRTKEVGGEPAVSVEDLKEMFLNKRLPDGWERWKKTRHDWITSTNALILSARKEYHALTRAS